MKKFLLSFSSIFEFLTLKEKEKCIFFYSESKYYRDHFIDFSGINVHATGNNTHGILTLSYPDKGI